ncbi:MAG: SdrD B-like domain-containing protein [Anaerolineae bacterium]|nr:SdrD B-like domain-containing protein [Anaerolineae bacterium]
MNQNKSDKAVVWRSLLITLGVVGVLALALFGLIGVSMAAPPNPVVKGPEPLPPPQLAGPSAPTGKSTLGDYVWYDQNVDGEHTTTPGEFEYNAGINNVRVNLYLDANKNAQIDAGEFVTYTLTGPKPGVPASSGWYSFSVTAEGNWYIVEIDSSNFALGGPLENYVHTSISTYGTWANTHLAVMPNIPVYDYAVADFGYAMAGIQVVKTAGNAADGEIEYLNGPTPVDVTYYFVVTNQGDTPLGSVSLSDDTCTGVVTFTGGDSDGDGLLDTNETWTYTCAHSEGDNGLTTNTATVTGNPTDANGDELPGIPPVSDTDDAKIFVVNPDIQLVKLAGDAPDGEIEYILSGESVQYTYIVTNTGDTYLSNIVITDDNGTPGVPGDDFQVCVIAGPLAPGASASCTHTINNITEDRTNWGTAVGTPTDSNGNDLPDIPNVSDRDDAEVRIYDLDFGDLPNPYPTLLANNGPRHIIGDVWMGPTVDAELDGQPSLHATGDDTNNLDDEDGVVFLGSTPVAGNWTHPYRSDKYIGGWTGGVKITITAEPSAVGKTVYLHAWFDFDHDRDLSDTGENVFCSVPIVITAAGSKVYGPPGAAGVDVVVPQLQFPIPLGSPKSPAGDLYTRFRLDEQGLNEFVGLAWNGEVEDYWLEFGQGSLDFGDAPDPTYPTLIASNGARHIIGNIWMGALIDAEPDGQPVNQDDVVNLDDEDGVTFLGWKKSAGVYQMPFIAGRTGAVRIVVTGGSGYLHGWIDWNQDGDWNDAGENIFSGVFKAPGTHTIEFSVPSAAQGTVAGTTWARFRLDSENLNSPVGLSNNGEVEDYPEVPVVFPGQLGDFVWWDVDYDGRQDAGEPGIPDVLVNLYDSTGVKIKTDTTDGSGFYLFDDLNPDTYRIQIDPSEFAVGGTLYQWYASPKDAAPDDVDSDGHPTTHDVTTVLTAGEVDLTNDFGFDKLSDYEITKQLNTPLPLYVGYPLSFTIRITNIGHTWIGILPLIDTYDTSYLTYGYQDPNTLLWSYADPDSDDHVNDGVINWSDLTVSFGQDLAPGASFTVIVTFTAKADTGLLLPDGKTENLAIVEGAYADADGPGPLGPEEPLPTRQDPERVPIETPTAVTLAGFAAAVQPEGVLVSWATANELDILGFNVLRQAAGGEFELVNAEFIFAQVAGTGNSAAYEFLDAGVLPGAYAYTLEVMHLDGRVERYGLVEVVVGQ